MKTSNAVSLVTIHVSLFTILLAPSAFAQGNLAPPGAPAPTMKTLDQIEPRTPIKQASLPFTINASGSYYVTENLSVASGNAITINASGVTLDLTGFTITSSSATAAGSAVLINSGLHDISILNGHIVGGVTYNGTSFSTGPGFQTGINYTGTNPGNVRVSGVSVAGCSLTGIELGFEYSNVVDHCTVRVVGGQGIHAGAVSDATAYQCGSNGINAITASGCYGTTTASARGVYSDTAVNCVGVSVSGVGLDSITASSCYGSSNDGTGLNATSAESSFGMSGGGFGILATNAHGCYGLSSSAQGIRATAVSDCYGQSDVNVGVLATNAATNCYGKSDSSYGLSTGGTAIGCYGFSTSGTGLNASVAIGCGGSGSPAVFATHKYLSGIGPDS